MTARDVIAKRIHVREHPDCIGGPSSTQVEAADAILSDLAKNGFTVVRSFDLSALWSFLGSAATAFVGSRSLLSIRADQWRKTVRSWIPDERHEDD